MSSPRTTDVTLLWMTVVEVARADASRPVIGAAATAAAAAAADADAAAAAAARVLKSDRV